ncbi:MAG: hypothetical protein IJB96_03990 [Lachnospira sp.]|nr:hypothetical protein [Lachnospira sp.]
MKKSTRLIITMSMISAVLLSGCGQSSTSSSSGGGGSNYVAPTFISTQPATSETEAPKESSSAAGENTERETGTVVPDESVTIVAMDNSPYLKGISLKTTLTYLTERYGSAPVYNTGSRTYRWNFGDKGTVIATHQEEYPENIIEITYSPSDYSTWRDSRNDFSKIDTSKTYGYSEICNLIGSSGTVSKLSRTIMIPTTYHVCWYKPDGTVLNVQFDASTNKSIYIQLL